MDGKIYRTRDGTRCYLARNRQVPIDPRDPSWLKKIHEDANNEVRVVRIKDGHTLWGVTVDDLVTEA